MLAQTKRPNATNAQDSKKLHGLPVEIDPSDLLESTGELLDTLDEVKEEVQERRGCRCGSW